MTEFTKLGLKELIFTDAVSCTGEDGVKALEAALAFHVSDQLGGQKVQLPLDREYHALEVPWGVDEMRKTNRIIGTIPARDGVEPVLRKTSGKNPWEGNAPVDLRVQ